jgi:putative NADH-flavin reductase
MRAKEGSRVKLAIIGSTGLLGQELVAQALEEGHHVTAFARDPRKLTRSHANLRVVQGDVLDGSKSLEPAVEGQDAVVSALGVGESFKPGGLIARSTPHVLLAMEARGVQRLIVTSGIIVKLDLVPAIPRLLMRLLMKELAADKKAGEDLLRQSRLDWTIVYPTRLTTGPKTGKYRSGERLKLSGIPRVSRADVADLILKSIGDTSSIRKDIVISD